MDISKHFLLNRDNNIPWHSSCITERVSSNLVKTASGGIYFLIGKMSHYHSSCKQIILIQILNLVSFTFILLWSNWKISFLAFPSWFRKKFLFGFPEMWKEYLNKFLTDNEGYVNVFYVPLCIDIFWYGEVWEAWSGCFIKCLFVLEVKKINKGTIQHHVNHKRICPPKNS